MQNAQSVTEMLRYVPGVNVKPMVRIKGYDWIFMRSFNALPFDQFLSERTSALQFLHLLQRRSIRGLDSSKCCVVLFRLYGQSDAGESGQSRVTKRRRLASHEASVEYGSFNRKPGSVDLTETVNEDKTLLYRLIGVVRKGNTQFEPSMTTRSRTIAI